MAGETYALTSGRAKEVARLLAVLAAAAGFAAGGAILRFASALVASSRLVALGAVAATSAVGGAAAGASPTGIVGADLVATAAVGATMALAASRAGAAPCAAAAALAVACSGGSPEAAVGAGVSLGLAVAVLATAERAPVLLAVAGGAVAQAVMRLEWPEPFGASALAGFAVSGPLLCLGVARGPATVRSVVVRVTGAVVLSAAAASVVAVVAAVGSRAAVDVGVTAAGAGLAALERVDPQAAVEYFETAAASFEKADDDLAAWWAQPARLVPVAGQHALAVRTLAGAGADLAALGARTAGHTDLRRLRFTNGGIDLAALAEVRASLENALPSMVHAERTLDGAGSPWLVEPVAERLEDLHGRVQSASASTRTALSAVRAAPSLLGAEGPRRYFLAVQTPAEARGSGGLMGNFGELIAEAGRIRLGRFGRVQELNDGGVGAARGLSGPPDYLRRYGPYRPNVFWQSVTMSPDFPTVAKVIAELYPQSGGTAIDGVVSIDPVAFAALLQLLGPLPVEGRPEPLTAENAARVLLHKQYVTFSESDRVDFLATATVALFQRLTSTTLPAPRVVADTLAPMVAGRHLQLASTHRGEQRFFQHIGAAGGVPPVRGDSLGVVTQNFGGNKIDWFLRRTYSYEALYDPRSGIVRSRLDVHLRNKAPADGLPRSVIGYGGIPPTFTKLGDNLLMLSVYSPLALRSITLDGVPLTAHEDTELGRRVYSALVTVPARSTRTVSIELAGRLPPGTSYRLDLVRQPTVVADEAELSVELAPGWRAQEARGLRSSGGAKAAASVSVDRNLAFEVDAERTQTGVLERFRRGR